VQAALENKRKITIKSSRNVLKMNNIIEEGGASRSGVRKKEGT
jgi:hypothetical protein